MVQLWLNRTVEDKRMGQVVARSSASAPAEPCRAMRNQWCCARQDLGKGIKYTGRLYTPWTQQKRSRGEAGAGPSRGGENRDARREGCAAIFQDNRKKMCKSFFKICKSHHATFFDVVIYQNNQCSKTRPRDANKRTDMITLLAFCSNPLWLLESPNRMTQD